MSVSMPLRAVTEILTGCRIKPSGSCQSRCSGERSRRYSHAVESSHRAHVNLDAAENGHGDTHGLSNEVIGLMSVSMQRERSRRYSRAVKSSHRAHVSLDATESGHGDTHRLSNQAIGLMSVSMPLRAVTEILTGCRIKPSGSCQSRCS